MWHVVSVTSRMELDTVARISQAGFVAHCPTFQKKYGPRRRGAHLFRTVDVPLFPSYILTDRDAALRIEKFVTPSVWLSVHWNSLLTQDHVDFFEEVAKDMTNANGDLEAYRMAKMPKPAKIDIGDIVQILHGAMQGDHVEVLRARKDQVLVDFKRRAGWRPAWINRTSLGRAV